MKKQLLLYGLATISFLLGNDLHAQSPKTQSNLEFGKGIQFQSADSSFTLGINGRIQSLLEVKQDLQAKTTGADMFIRRCRLNFQGNAFNSNFSYRIQLCFSQADISSGNVSVTNNLILRDAMIYYHLGKGFRVGFGQTKLPGNRQRQVSSGNLQLVERSIANNNFTLDRDKGVWLFHRLKIKKSIVNSTLAISSGEGRIASDRNGKLCYSGRIEWLPFGEFTKNGDYIEGDMEREKKPKLSIAGAYSYNEATSRTMGQLGDYLYNSQTAHINYFGGDIMFKYRGLSILAEYYNRNANTGVIVNKKDTTQKNYILSGNTLLLQTGYFISKKNEIAFRYAQITPHQKLNGTMNNQQEIVAGFSHYFSKHQLKLQTDLTYAINGASKNIIYRVSGVISF